LFGEFGYVFRSHLLHNCFSGFAAARELAAPAGLGLMATLAWKELWAEICRLALSGLGIFMGIGLIMMQVSEAPFWSR